MNKKRNMSRIYRANGSMCPTVFPLISASGAFKFSNCEFQDSLEGGANQKEALISKLGK